MNKFFQKLIIIGVATSIVAGFVMIGFSIVNTAKAETGTTGGQLGPVGPQPISNSDAVVMCNSFLARVDSGGLTNTELIVAREKLYQECLKDPNGVIKDIVNVYDKSIKQKRGKLVLPVGMPYSPNFPAIPGTESLSPTAGIPQLITFAYLAGLWLVGLVVFVQITMSGVRWLVSAGKPEEIAKAKNDITNALLGLVLLLSSYVILNTINPDLLNSVFDPPKIGTGTMRTRN